MPKIPKVFISYHHKREQKNKNKLVELFKKHHSEHFEIKDTSVGLDAIDINLLYKKLIKKELNKENIKKINKEFKKELYKKLNKEIFKIIREKYLKDSNVTILILGKHTKCRQHIDWEIATSLMSYGSLDRRKRNGMIIF
ncbi:TIR domain-containing protein [Spiroplasma endosymbiont of Virgichneumon dumeticola]|uniref:TIR domain-containing protein n=1 Tax=Spiroplasma endosymbiont of Virgichneumon dumeticola TaxID=3139323 RepID=UPI0035C8A033